MVSLKHFCKCINLSGAVSIVHDFFGYTSIPRLAADVAKGRLWEEALTGIVQHAEVSDQLSVLKQVHLLQNKYFNVNLILVGAELFSVADEHDLDAAVQITRDIYEQINLGIGRLQWWAISEADAKGLENITSNSDAQNLTNDWTVPNDAVDVFVVRSYRGVVAGNSPVDGPCDKDRLGKMTGSVVTIHKYIGLPNDWTTSGILAHELGHYLGLNHVSDPSNLMNPASWGTDLTEQQGRTMKEHCFVKHGC
jgi:hypothetical protein